MKPRRPEGGRQRAGNFRPRARVLVVAITTVNDDELIDDALAGDSAAFGRLVCKYQDRLWHTLTHLLGSADDARDVVQDAFVQAFIKLETFQRAAAFYTWVYRIAINGAHSLRRRRKPTVSLDHLHDSADHEPLDRGDGPDGRLCQQERSRQVQAALATLSDEFRSVVVLREIDGCDYDTIAETLDLPVGTVRSRLHRARLQLRDQLKEVLQHD